MRAASGPAGSDDAAVEAELALLRALDAGELGDPLAVAAYLAGQRVELPAAESHAARRRALLLLAAAGGLRREPGVDERAVKALAADLHSEERVRRARRRARRARAARARPSPRAGGRPLPRRETSSSPGGSSRSASSPRSSRTSRSPEGPTGRLAARPAGRGELPPSPGGCDVRVCPVDGEAQRSLFRRWPAGVCVVVAESGGRRAGLTVSSLVSRLARAGARLDLARALASLFEVLARGRGPGPSRSSPPTRRTSPSTSRAASRRSSSGTGFAVRADEPRLLAGRGRLDRRPHGRPVRRRRPRDLRRRQRAARAGPRRGRARLRRPRLRRRCDRRGRVRPRRGARRLRAGLGRGARGARARARRRLAPGRPAGHDGDELTRVVALHARPDRARRGARGDQPAGRRADARPLRGGPALAPGRARGGRPAGRGVPARARLVLEPRADRRRARRRRHRRAASAATVSSEEVARGKPAPDVYLEAARRLERRRRPPAWRSRTPTTASARPRRPG